MHNKEHEHHQHYALAVFATFAVTAIIVGVLVFQFQEKQFAERLSKTDAELQKAGEIVQELQTEKDGLSEKVDKVSEALSDISTKKSANITEQDLPKVVFTPSGAFIEAERAELMKKIVEPFKTYHNTGNDEYVALSINIKKNDKGDVVRHGHLYSAEAIHSPQGSEGWIFGENGTIDYWRPTCMDYCNYSDEFKEKYPDLVE